MLFTDARKYKKEVNALYERAFPVKERAATPLLYRRLRAGKAHFYAITEEGKFIGLAYIICHGELAYLFYLAIHEDFRGMGYGSRILKTLRKHYKGYTMILNIEDPHDLTAENFQERRRRLHFYERNGFCDLDVQTNEMGIVFELLGTDPKVTQADYLNLIKDFLGHPLYRLVFRYTIIDNKQGTLPVTKEI